VNAVPGKATPASGDAPAEASATTHIPTARYWSRDWAEREQASLWPRAWQFACAADSVPHPGDWYEYRLGSLSAVIVRGADGVIRAFQNACRHRGAALLQGEGSGLERLRCPYHHWSYDLCGRRGRTAGELDLLPVRAAVWAGLVFVNWDAAAEPLAQYLDAIPAELAWLGMERYTCRYAVTVPIGCNWKLVMDAFNEAYHIHAVHPQLLAAADDVNLPIRMLGRHSTFEQTFGIPSPRLGAVSDEAMWTAFLENVGHRLGEQYSASAGMRLMPTIPPGQQLRDVLVALLREHLESVGDPYPGLSEDKVLNDFHYYLFPNTVINIFAGWFGLIRARPGEHPDTAWLDMWNFDLLAPDDPATHGRPQPLVLAQNDTAALGLVLQQDFRLLPEVQRGMRQPGLETLRLTPAESRIAHMHRVLDQYLPGGDSA
jgi:phenylpropionate dioxygenase-like ring-hydroxylating dioxygenase large terminal subunit